MLDNNDFLIFMHLMAFSCLLIWLGIPNLVLDSSHDRLHLYLFLVSGGKFFNILPLRMIFVTDFYFLAAVLYQIKEIPLHISSLLKILKNHKWVLNFKFFQMRY